MSLSHSNKSLLQNFFDWFSNQWLKAAYGSAKWIYLFYPFTLIFFVVSRFRKYWLELFFQPSLSVPVIVVGNISLGGTGKTPLLIALVQHFQRLGKKVGVVSRGYGGRAMNYPCLLNKDSQVSEVGDEPLMIFNRTCSPTQSPGAFVCVGSDRVASAQKLIALGCDIILSDDGLQHYSLARDIEILVVDAVRQFGNQQLIPTGPLRESVRRASQVDLIGINETLKASTEFKSELVTKLSAENVFGFKLVPKHFVRISSGESFSISEFISANSRLNQICYFVAGIGHPEGFFSILKTLGLAGQSQVFPDHHPFAAQDFESFESNLVVMTEKDAVKVKGFAQPNWYYLESGVELDPVLLNLLDQQLAILKK